MLCEQAVCVCALVHSNGQVDTHTERKREKFALGKAMDARALIQLAVC